MSSETGAFWDMGEFSRRLHIEKSGRSSRNQCAKNLHCWRYLCSPCLKSSPWTVTLPIHIQWAQTLASSDHHANVVFCQWLPTKCIVNTQFVCNILINDEVGFTKGGIVNFHATHIWMDDSPHIITASRRHHQFSINNWVGILGDQLLGPVVLYAVAVRSCLVWGSVVFLCSGLPVLHYKLEVFDQNIHYLNFFQTTINRLCHSATMPLDTSWYGFFLTSCGL